MNNPDEEYDWTGKVELLNKDDNIMSKGHSFKMVLGLAVLFLVGAHSAFVGGFGPSNIIDMIVAGLLAAEHGLNGAS